METALTCLMYFLLANALLLYGAIAVALIRVCVRERLSK